MSRERGTNCTHVIRVGIAGNAVSLQAQLWAASLPLDACGLAEFRVLDKLADHAHGNGRNAFRNVESMAAELQCSKRTVQRALRSLQVLGLIRIGDQHLVNHLPANRRPIVYDLALERFGVTTGVTPLDGMTTGVTPPVDKRSRGDRSGLPGVTTGVVLGTKEEPLREIPSATTDCEHAFSAKYRVCVYCGVAA